MYYFAYGSNMNLLRLQNRLGYTPKYQKGVLDDYELIFNLTNKRIPGSAYANIRKKAQSKVEGILYSISEEDFKKLDLYEAFPKHYIKIQVLVKNSHAVVNATTYIGNKDLLENNLKPTREYINYLLNPAVELSPEYYKKLSGYKTLD
ncbi:MAG: hypothetical protein APR63_14040 [Desulfuromonas sp. SDB]|nr:MAG: hypothetical protein APR63_14040 [Desulfuromonas sp. SDB]